MKNLPEVGDLFVTKGDLRYGFKYNSKGEHKTFTLEVGSPLVVIEIRNADLVEVLTSHGFLWCVFFPTYFEKLEL